MKAVIVSVADDMDIRNISKLIKRALNENGTEAAVNSFEDKKHLAKELYREGRYEIARKEVHSHIRDRNFNLDEQSISLLADTALFYLEREREKIEEEKIEKVVDRALKDIKTQLEVHEECKKIAKRLGKAVHEKTLDKIDKKENHRDDKIPHLQQALV